MASGLFVLPKLALDQGILENSVDGWREGVHDQRETFEACG